jgi:hypothetical protein
LNACRLVVEKEDAPKPESSQHHRTWKFVCCFVGRETITPLSRTSNSFNQQWCLEHVGEQTKLRLGLSNEWRNCPVSLGSIRCREHYDCYGRNDVAVSDASVDAERIVDLIQAIGTRESRRRCEAPTTARVAINNVSSVIHTHARFHRAPTGRIDQNLRSKRHSESRQCQFSFSKAVFDGENVAVAVLTVSRTHLEMRQSPEVIE